MRRNPKNDQYIHPIFDVEWYSSQSKTIFSTISEAFSHYLEHGWRDGLSPHALFSVDDYSRQFQNPAEAQLEPLTHFVTHGWKEGRRPHPLFDVAFYVSQVPDFGSLGVDPLTHYLTVGRHRGLRPNPHFDPAFYLEGNPDVLAAGDEPLSHYIKAGEREDRRPHQGFSPRAYAVEHALPDNISPLAFFSKQQAETRSDLSEHEVQIDLTRELRSDVRPIGVFIHIFYETISDEIANAVLKIDLPKKIYVSTDTREKAQHITNMFARYGIVDEDLIVRVTPNKGFDIAPFLIGFGDVIGRHEICVKIHAKVSNHTSRDFGQAWRRYLLDQLLLSPERVRAIVANFEADPKLGMLIPAHWEPLRQWIGIGSNYEEMRRILDRIGVKITRYQKIVYPSGSMFWFRSAALAQLLDLNLTYDDFGATASKDATLAHGVERSLLYFVASAKYSWAILPRRNVLQSANIENMKQTIRDAGVFNADYYRATYSDVAEAGIDPLEHYLKWGWKEGRNPSAVFNTNFYRRAMSHEADEDVPPLYHYAVYGREKNLPTRRNDKVPAQIRVDNLYSPYGRAETGREYERETFPLIRRSDLKTLAFYFPQFHPFAENNKFWGRGFTEWTNTTKALPMFRGHYQPRLPGEIGFYDTRLKPVLERQIEMAKQFGVHGFCFHHYFFSGKPVMRAPYDNILAHPDLDIPFCLHWANEPWTVRWDGLASQSGVLLAQSHSPEDDVAFFRDIEPALRDRRYITVDGRPLLVIYRPSLFPDMRATLDRWRSLSHKAGLREPYMVVMHTGFEGPVDPNRYGFDAAIEYPPHHLGVKPINERVDLFDPHFEGNIYDYQETVEKALDREMPNYRLFRGIMPEWDCTPRRRNPDLFVNCAPRRYEHWLGELCNRTARDLPKSEQFIFINAWNEWAEGAYLEPDRKYGYGYLAATARAVNAFSDQPRIKNKLRILIGAHIFYTDLLDEFVDEFRKMPVEYDLFVTTSDEDVASVEAYLAAELGSSASHITVVGVPNIGRDFAPFILNYLPKALDYDLACWVHSKKSPYEKAYDNWRSYLLSNLLGSPTQISALLETFDGNDELGLAYPTPFHAVAGRVEWGSNFELAAMLLKRIGIDIHQEMMPEFPTAAMFWFRPCALKTLLDLKLTLQEFERYAEGPRDTATGAIVDGTISHALERMLIYITRAAGYTTKEFSFRG